jgi:hypothetical protein
MKRPFRMTWLRPAPRGGAELCAAHEAEHVPRRTMLKGFVVAAAGVAAAVGSTVGFAPTAIAAPSCDYGEQRAPCGNPTGCMGPCLIGASCCGNKCCASMFWVRVVTWASGKACYMCCQYC